MFSQEKENNNLIEKIRRVRAEKHKLIKNLTITMKEVNHALENGGDVKEVVKNCRVDV